MGLLTAGIEFAEFTAQLLGKLFVLFNRFQQGACPCLGATKAEA